MGHAGIRDREMLLSRETKLVRGNSTQLGANRRGKSGKT